LEAAAASQEAFRSQISALKEVNTTQQNNIMMLQGELLNSKSEYDRLLVDSNADRAALQARISDLETQRTELREAVVEQQVKISKLERQVPGGISGGPPDAPPESTKLPKANGKNPATPKSQPVPTLSSVHQPYAPPAPAPVTGSRSIEREVHEHIEYAEREAKERAEREALSEDYQRDKRKAAKDAREKVQLEAKRSELEAKGRTDQEATENSERKEREKAEQEAKEKAKREAKEKAEREDQKAERDEKDAREIQRENTVERLFGPNRGRKRNNTAQSQVTTKSLPISGPSQSGRGLWGSSILNSVASGVAIPDRTPSPELNIQN